MSPSTPATLHRRLRERLARLYGEPAAGELADRVCTLLDRWRPRLCAPRAGFDQRDSLLITYADAIRADGEAPLATLQRFACDHLAGVISAVHLLPFFPWSSDDGFSVIDHRAVDPTVGSWSDVEALSAHFELAFDLVLNHASARSPWFQQFVADEAPGRAFFRTCDPAADLSAVVRPRSHPLLAPVQTARGERHVWTTFSADQVDLDFGNPEVLLEFVDIVLGYLGHGARILRLDAIAYLWKEPGTGCIHLPGTHEVVKLLRDVVDEVAPGTVLLTETNVPHAENVAYFGDGDEAQLVYQFSLPPLLLLALIHGDARALSAWAAALEPPPPGCSYLNFTASHDGVGLRPLEGLVPPAQIDTLVARARRLGGQVSARRLPDGTDVPYELNITYFDALGDDPERVTEAHLRRFLLSQTVPMSLQGVPAFYLHSLTATRNWQQGVAETGRARTVNRRRWSQAELHEQLADERSPCARVFGELVRRLRIRRRETGFHPGSPQWVVQAGTAVFAVLRQTAQADLLCLHNLGPQSVVLQPDRLSGSPRRSGVWQDILEDGAVAGDRGWTLGGYRAAWLRQLR